jgi:tetratricopeptide (TPR) repeat protein
LPGRIPALPARRLADGAILGLLATVTFLLGCYEMGDSDIWWHLRGGEWILEHGCVPQLDPFTFGSADRKWVDIHWAYEVTLALAHRAGGAAALVLLGATVGAAAFVVALTARRRQWPVAVAVLSWAPTLVLFAFRLDPRPEIFSLLYISLFLAVLWRLDDRPALAWLLPVVQLLWVNMQGLFIFGPILLGLFLAARAAPLLWAGIRGMLSKDDARRRWWRHVAGAACAVGATCLVNPYLLDGVRFPFDLFPKVTEAGNPYKSYIDELMSPRDFVARSGAAAAGQNWFFLAFHFLLLLLPVSFVAPALWRAVWPKEQSRGTAWVAGLGAVVLLLAVSTWTLTGRWSPGLGENVPFLLLAGGAAVAVVLRNAGREAVALAVAGAVGEAAWAAWLRFALLSDGRGGAGTGRALAWGLLAAVAGAVAIVLIVRRGGDLFRVLLAVAFSYLALQALQNWSRFALVAGTVLAWNFGEWAAAFPTPRHPSRVRVRAAWGLRAALAGGVAAWLVVLLTDRYYAHTGEPRHLAFREQPLEFAHEAAAFAGRPGMPERALVYGLGQTGVYVYHNAPERKPFMDGRLEMPDRATFETYVAVEDALRGGTRAWEPAVARMGNPLLLLEHQNNHVAEAQLLTHPGWRCVYFDALASVFVPRGTVPDVPTVDFAARHFQQPPAASVPALRGAARREEKALFNLAASLPRGPETAWHGRIPVLWAALDRAGLALEEAPDRAEAWVVLGNCYWNLDPDLHLPPPSPPDGWALERNIYLAQATWCFRRGLEVEPEHGPAWRCLAQAYAARGMVDARVAAAEHWLRNDPKAPERDREQTSRLRDELSREPAVGAPPIARLPGVVAALLKRRRHEAAAQLLDGTPADWPWDFADQAATLYMHLGRPEDARRAWEQATDCPSAAVRECRLAATYWVEREFEAAAQHFYAARLADPRSAEACWGLALLHAQCGAAGSAREACRAGRNLPLNGRQSADLEGLQKLLVTE